MREYRYVIDKETGEQWADVKTEKLTMDEAWEEFNYDIECDFVPFGAAFEKYTRLLEVLMFHLACCKIDSIDFKLDLDVAHAKMNEKIGKMQDGKLKKLPQ